MSWILRVALVSTRPDLYFAPPQPPGGDGAVAALLRGTPRLQVHARVKCAATGEDVGVVIDTGRMKEHRYDGGRLVASLEDVVVSRANARQRRGRAGRAGRLGALAGGYHSHRGRQHGRGPRRAAPFEAKVRCDASMFVTVNLGYCTCSIFSPQTRDDNYGKACVSNFF